MVDEVDLETVLKKWYQDTSLTSQGYECPTYDGVGVWVYCMWDFDLEVYYLLEFRFGAGQGLRQRYAVKIDMLGESFQKGVKLHPLDEEPLEMFSYDYKFDYSFVDRFTRLVFEFWGE